MSRNPRAGTSGLTKTQQLRQAKSAALVKDYERKDEAAARQQPDPFRKRIIKRPEPKKIDFSKPGMTKTMLARVKQAEKFKQEYERKQQAISTDRRPRRTPAPIGGDARMGRERIVDRETRRTQVTSRPTTPRTSPVARREFEAGPSRLPSPKKDIVSRLPKTPEQTVPKKTNELAQMMNADIVQAEAIGEGPINNIIIPPGVVNDNRTTIVSIQQPTADIEAKEASQVANRSIQVISETLDEQDAMEAAAVQNRLVELQQARRDFVIAVANVGGNAVNIEEESPPPSPPSFSPPPKSPPRRHIMKVPDLEDKYLQPEYGIDHPAVIAARKFLQKSITETKENEVAKRLEDEFEKMIAEGQISDDLHIEAPFEEEHFQERDISWEDDSIAPISTPSRVKSPVPSTPKQVPYEYETFDPEVLERFFDLQRYPPIHCPRCGPPPGREDLHPDLWELDDPWYRPPPGPDGPDLIEFDLIDFD